MTRGDSFGAGESPFLLEALEPHQGAEAPDPAAEVEALSRSLSPAAGRHLEGALARHLEGLFELEDGAPTPASSRDTALAVPPFSTTERRRVAPPLLGSSRSAAASRRNGADHPDRSGVGPDVLRSALRDYVDFDAVARAVGDARDSVITDGSTFDAVLVEAIHQFQKKAYLVAKHADGIAGGSTLESLGLIHHRLPRPDATNAAAKAVILRQAREISGATGGRFSAHRWYQDFVNPSFLGHRFKVAVHPTLLAQLRKAEVHLLQKPAYAGMTPVALGRALGFTPEREPHAGGRPEVRKGSAKNSFHLYGLATDIRYLANPWVAGNPAQTAHGNKQFMAVMERASLLMRGQALRVDPRYLAGLASRPTADICAVLRGLSDTFKDYLALARDPVALRRQIASQQGSAKGVVETNETLDGAVQRWAARIERDIASLHRKGNFKSRDPREGFFDLPADLVVALRDHAGLAWGAVDIGETQSGDLMHFDLRRLPIGKAVRAKAPRTGPTSGGPRPKVEPAPARHVDPPGETLYAQIPVQSARTRSQVGIFVPERFRARPEIDLVIYLHGLLGPCSSPGPNIDRYWDTGLVKPGLHKGEGPMALREALNASRKSAVLVAPSLGRSSQADALIARGGFDRLIAEVLAALQDHSRLTVKPRAVRHIVLAGHSKGGAHMRGIVTRRDAAAARIKEAWGFDCLYSPADPEAWRDWAQADQQRLFYHCYLQGWKRTREKLTPWRHNETLRDLAKAARLENVLLEKAPARENHCSIPLAVVGKRLEASAYLDRI